MGARIGAVSRALACALIGTVMGLGVPGTSRGLGQDTGSIEPLTPLPTDERRVEIGRRLFADARLSGDGERACATCHDLAQAGIAPSPRPSAHGSIDGFDTLSVFNAALNYRFGWLAEQRTLEAFSEEVILSPEVMGGDWDTVIPRLRTDEAYVRLFHDAYGRGWDRTEVLDALSEFQRSLVTTNSPFDRYLRGEREAIAPLAEQGYRLFQGYGCISCHQGRNIGGNLVQKFGVFAGPVATSANPLTTVDLGRLVITGQERDRHVFRVPSLRNVAVTAPYLHDGSVRTLPEVVAVMGRTQLGRELPRADIEAITAFLQTLTGEYGGVSLSTPERGGAK